MDTPKPWPQSGIPKVGKAEKTFATNLVTGKDRSGHRISQQTTTDKSLPKTEEEAFKENKPKTTSLVTSSQNLYVKKAKPVTTPTSTSTDSSASKPGQAAQVTASGSSGANTEKYPRIPLEPEIKVITDQSAEKDSGTIGKIEAAPANNKNSADKNSAPLLNNTLAKYLKLEDESDKQTLKNEILKIIQNTTDIDYQDSEGNTPLHLAVATQDLEIVEAIKTKNPNLMKQNNLQRTALHEASALYNSDILPLLLPAGVNHCQSSDPRQTDFIDQPDSAGLSPLSISLIHANPHMTHALIKLGAHPALKDEFGRTALHRAVMYSAENCIDTLLQSTPTLIDELDAIQCTALHRACLFGQAGIVEKITNSSLFDYGKHLALQDKEGRTPIACAVFGLNANCMETLINKGASLASVDIQDYKGSSLVAQACLSCCTITRDDKAVNNIVNALIARGVKPTIKMAGDLSCLHLVAQSENVELFKLLLNAGLDPTQQNNTGQTPLHYAANCGSAGIVQLLLSTEGVSANTTDHEGSLPLHYACHLQQEGNLKQESINATIKRLLRKTVDPNTPNSKGATPLITACRLGRKDIITELLRDGRVNPNSPGENGFAPIFCVVERIMKDEDNKDDYLAVMSLLLKSRADANAHTPDGTTLLDACIAIGDPAVVKTLLRGAGDGIDVNLANLSDGYRPLVHACFLLPDPYDTVKELLVKKADPKLGNVVIDNNQASNDWTPLHALLSPKAKVKKPEERWKVAKLLMDHKASPYQPSRKYNDCTPLHVAIDDLKNETLAIQMIQHTPPRKQDLILRQANGLTAAQMAGEKGYYILQKLLTEKMT